MIQTYLPLYRKYRPQSFAGLVGQDAIRQTLTNAITMDRVAHAYLFCGPRGTGKTSTARIFSKSLNCEQGPTPEPCQVCASCTGIAQGQALDVIEFDAASHNGVQDARDLIETCQFAPMAGRYKIYIIDEVHMLSSQAFNALLKTLEEPPERVVFIFATTEAHKVLPTIVSRCQRFDFTRIPLPALEKHVQYVAAEETIDLQPDAVTLIARSAKGGLRDALSLLDQVSVMFQGQTVTAQTIRGLMGGIGPDTLLNVTRDVTRQDVAGLLVTLEQLEKDGLEPARLVAALTEHIRDLMLYAQAPQAIHPDVASSGRYAEQTPWFAPEHYPQWLTRLSQLDRQLKQTSQPQLWLEVTLVELAHRETLHTLADLASRVSQLETALQPGGTPPVRSAPQTVHPVQAGRPVQPVAAPQPLATATPPARVEPHAQAAVQSPVQDQFAASNQPVVPQTAQSGSGDLSLTWQTITDRVPSPATKGLLRQQTFLKTLTDTELVIGVSSEAILKTLQAPDKQIHLKQAIKSHFGAERSLHMLIEKLAKPGAGVPGSPAPGNTVAAPLPAEKPVEPMPVAPYQPAPVRAVEPVHEPGHVLSPVYVPNSPVSQMADDDDMPPLVEGPLDEPDPQQSPLMPVPAEALPVVEADLQASKDYAVRLLQAQPLDS
jgi:DNA polymerase III subunit gamma/tau